MLHCCGNNQPTPGPMARKPRFFLPGVPLHIVQRGNNRQPIWFDDFGYRAWLDWLK
jgi:REP element-mobilizing transposase RayT